VLTIKDCKYAAFQAFTSTTRASFRGSGEGGGGICTIIEQVVNNITLMSLLPR